VGIVPCADPAPTAPARLGVRKGIPSLPGQTWLSVWAQHFWAYMLTRWHAWMRLPLPARLEKTVALRRTAISRNVQARMTDLARLTPASKMLLLCSAWIITMTILNYIIMLPLLNIFWADHLPSVREQRIEQLLAMIPPD